ncbi:uncharacterized protein LOC107467907 [Arachis duranensis]|uniref:Uncharacterized protein LOC107467907 n=1 Tax=Arachis duranensis TaxID=130453 RepID=A0A6P4BMN0_ARADU|nr:uncharacterized protein LOC107467907 [Arachis duranensis]
MKVMKVKLLKSWLRGFTKLGKVKANFLIKCAIIHEKIDHMWIGYCFLFQNDEESLSSSCSYVPKDVPKGHLVVYVGEDCKRFVIKVGTLNNPLIKALLDHAEDVFGFDNNMLRIPCNETIFLNILRNATTLEDDQHHNQSLLHCF